MVGGDIQCDQIEQFIALWATFQSLGQQTYCSHFKAIFVNVSKSFILLVKSFLGNFYRYLATTYTLSIIVFVLCLVCEKNENKQKEARFAPFKKVLFTTQF